jgi:plastocyanin
VIRLAPILAALALALAGCGGSSSSSSQTTGEETTSGETTTAAAGGGASMGELDGEVGPGFTIEVSRNGEDAESVPAGTYTLKVEDKSDQHNFHLIGPGVDETVTEVPFQGDKSVTVTLKPGTYTYQCDPHAANVMKGTFTVT